MQQQQQPPPQDDAGPGNPGGRRFDQAFNNQAAAKSPAFWSRPPSSSGNTHPGPLPKANQAKRWPAGEPPPPPEQPVLGNPAPPEANLAKSSPKKMIDTAIAIEYESLPPYLLTPLNSTWCLWYSNGTAKTAENFEQCLVAVGMISTAEAFWALYSHCTRPSNLPKGTEYHLFREGIRPMWEDPANTRGGTLLLRLKKGHLDYYWEALCLALIGENLGLGINGAVAGKRFTDDHLSVWNECYDECSHSTLSQLTLQALGLPVDAPTEYRSHSGSLIGARQAAATTSHNNTNEEGRSQQLAAKPQ